MATAAGAAQIIDVAVTEDGFVPPSINAPAGRDLTLRVTRKTDNTCALKIQVPSKKLKIALPLNKPVDLKIGKLEKGKISFGCGMGMMIGGVILVE